MFGRLFLYVRSLLGNMKGCGFRRELAEGADARVGNNFVELGPNMEVVHAMRFKNLKVKKNFERFIKKMCLPFNDPDAQKGSRQ